MLQQNGNEYVSPKQEEMKRIVDFIFSLGYRDLSVFARLANEKLEELSKKSESLGKKQVVGMIGVVKRSIDDILSRMRDIISENNNPHGGPDE